MLLLLPLNRTMILFSTKTQPANNRMSFIRIVKSNFNLNYIACCCFFSIANNLCKAEDHTVQYSRRSHLFPAKMMSRFSLRGAQIIIYKRQLTNIS